MKKFITAAALLAAGTALANAATLVAQWDSFDFGEGKTATSTLGSTALSVVANGASTTTTSDGVLNVVGSLNNDNKTTVDLSSSGLSFEKGWTLAITVSSYTATGSYDMLVSVASGTAVGDGIGNNNQNPGYWGVNTGSPHNSSVVANRVGTFVLTYDSGTYALYLQDSGKDTLTNIQTLSNISRSGSLQTLALGSYVGTSSYCATTLNVSRMALYDGVLDATTITSGNVYIPEPSAFGLLAGAGALALVAARRRRKS